MKTRKRKRSVKAAPAIEASVVDAVAAETPVVATGISSIAEPADELSAAAVEALVAEPVVAQPVGETVPETVSETLAVAAEAVAEAISDSVDPTAETVVAESSELAEPAPAAAGEPVVVLAGNCSIKEATALKTSLCAVANESADVTLDVSAVERVDTATMQLLCAFVRDRSGRKQNVTWRGESQALRDAVRLLGVGALLGFELEGVAA